MLQLKFTWSAKVDLALGQSQVLPIMHWAAGRQLAVPASKNCSRLFRLHDYRPDHKWKIGFGRNFDLIWTGRDQCVVLAWLMRMQSQRSFLLIAYGVNQNSNYLEIASTALIFFLLSVMYPALSRAINTMFTSLANGITNGMNAMASRYFIHRVLHITSSGAEQSSCPVTVALMCCLCIDAALDMDSVF